ncbi:hypothetical protein ABT147_46020 [Streptomyces sp. NPDC001868]|uniref:hypothetical protein n=1 Tax=Streptomyces sp. NPDC001868 TaxID=3154401 RepID=UPI0033272224
MTGSLSASMSWAEDQVVVELRVPESDQAVIHRVEGVSEAAASVFATVLEAALPELSEPAPIPRRRSARDHALSAHPSHSPQRRGEGEGRGLGPGRLRPSLTALIAMGVSVVKGGEPAMTRGSTHSETISKTVSYVVRRR